MTDEVKQAVVDETKAAAEPAAAVEGAREDGDDLETLLAQFDQETAKPPPVSPPAPSAAPQPTVPPVDPRIESMLRRQEREDLYKVYDAVRGDTKAPDKFVRGFVLDAARENPTIERIFYNKDNDPKAWERIQTALAKEFYKDWNSRPDAAATEDRAAVAQAVRGASTQAPAERPPDFGYMSDQELREYTRKNFGF